MTIAIDGPAAAGKGTLARRLADRLDYAYLDTGSIYRAVGLKALRAGHKPGDAAAAEAAARALTPGDLAALQADPALRSEQSGQAASKVAAVQAVRDALRDVQRAFALAPPAGKAGAVLDGRDVGAVICPDAAAKFFITASVEARARRRFLELRSKGIESIESRVLAEMRERDGRDMRRAAAPLKPAGDAEVIDTSDLDAEAVFRLVLDRLRGKNLSSSV